MKLYAIIEVNDDYYDDFKEWYIRGDDLEIRYVEDNAYRYYEAIPTDMLKMKPLPEKKNPLDDGGMFLGKGIQGYNACIDEILGEENDKD